MRATSCTCSHCQQWQAPASRKMPSTSKDASLNEFITNAKSSPRISVIFRPVPVSPPAQFAPKVCSHLAGIFQLVILEDKIKLKGADHFVDVELMISHQLFGVILPVLLILPAPRNLLAMRSTCGPTAGFAKITQLSLRLCQ